MSRLELRSFSLFQRIFLNLNWLYWFLHQRNYIYKIMYKQTLYFQNTGHLSNPSPQIYCVSIVLCWYFVLLKPRLLSAINKNVMGFDLHHCSIWTKLLFIGGLKQNKTLCDKVSYCSDMSCWTMESNEPTTPRQPRRVAAFCSSKYHSS